MKNVAAIISYCTHDYKFLRYCVDGIKDLCDEIIVVYSESFYDGSHEDKELLNKTLKEFNDVKFVKFDIESNPTVRHACYARLAGFNELSDGIEKVFLIDADEVACSDKLKNYFEKTDYQQYDAIQFSSYWYFRSTRYQAKTHNDAVLFINRELLSEEIILNRLDRSGIFRRLHPNKNTKIEGVNGVDGLPMFHHYSWARTKEELLTKTNGWGHKEDKPWVKLIESEYSHAFNGRDFIHNYEYNVVESFVNFDIEDYYEKNAFSIIVHVHSDFKKTKACLESIMRHFQYEDVVIVDDGCAEESTVKYLNWMVKEQNWKIVKLQDSIGIMESCKKAISETIRENIFILSSKTIVTDSLRALSNILKDNNNIGVVGPSISSEDGIQSMPEAFDNRLSWNREKIEEYAKNLKKNNEIVDAELLNESCFGIKREVFDKVKVFDLDTIRKKGYKTVYVKGSYIHLND